MCGIGAISRNNPVYDGSDHGIDLVAEEHDGTYCAIQCKFYGRSNQLDWKGLTKFTSAISKKKSRYASSILIYTGKKLTSEQMREIEGHDCQLLDYTTLHKSNVDWGGILLDKPLKQKAKFKERQHQKEARIDVVRGLTGKDNNRGKMILPCGTGKTFVTLKIAEEMVGTKGTVLYLVPSISLMSQSIREWAEQKSLPHKYIGVCSDTRTGKDDEDASLAEMEIPVTTDAGKIAEQLAKKQSDAMRVVFSTYQSIFAISQALQKLNGGGGGGESNSKSGHLILQ